MTSWSVRIPSARGNKSTCVSDSQISSRGDDGLEGENPERARDGIFARKRFPPALGGIYGGDDELERADSERARK